MEALAESSRSTGPVWFDFDNTPQVLFLEPVLRTLRGSGYQCVATARRQAQTVALAKRRGIPVSVIGRGDRQGDFGKALGVIGRAARLARWARRRRPALLVSASRSAALAARLAGVSCIGMLDYEHAEQRILAFGCSVIWLPDVLLNVALPAATRRVARFYAGLKENLYLDSWSFDRAEVRRALGVEDHTYFVVARPPAETAHYASALSSILWIDTVRALAARSVVAVLVAPRTQSQEVRMQERLAAVARARVLTRVVDGPELVGAADLVVGGGGTMNREAAVLGVPVWSVFTGPAPAIDEQLSWEGRLRWVRSETELKRALADELPGRHEPRGPIPGGLQAIVKDLRTRLEG